MNLIAKQQLRKHFRIIRKNIPKYQRQTNTVVINKFLSKFIKRNKNIGVYDAIGSELNLDLFIKIAKKRKANIFVPMIENKSLRLWFIPINQSKNDYPSFQQRQTSKIRVNQLQLLLSPLIAIDQNGCRLGQGGGYYDKTLSYHYPILKPATFAVGFSCQISLDPLPEEIHDVKINGFISENGAQHF